jgi:hypothetical protein
VLAAFDKLLTDLALTDDQVKVASARHTTIRDFLKTHFTVLDDPAPSLTGSYSRKTIIRQERDIDIMAAFSVEKYWSNYKSNSNALVYLVREALNKQYGKSDVSTSGAAVLMQMTVFNVDVVPVFKREGGGYLVGNGAHGWKATNPPEHFEIMEKRNKADPALKPLVKIMKYWNLVNAAKLESFHLEMAIEQMWRSEKIGLYPDAVMRTLKVLAPWIKGTVNDPWGPGGRIDGYLDDELRTAAQAMAWADAEGSAKAEAFRGRGDERGAFAEWQKVFRNQFSAYG